MRPRRHSRRPCRLFGGSPALAAVASVVLLVGITPAAADEGSADHPHSDSASIAAGATPGADGEAGPAGEAESIEGPTGQPTERPTGEATEEAAEEPNDAPEGATPGADSTDAAEPDDESEPTGSPEPKPSSPEPEGEPTGEPSQEPTDEKTSKQPRSVAPAPERADAAAADEAPTALRLEPRQTQVTAGDEISFTVWADGADGAPSTDVTAESTFEFVGGSGACDDGVCRSERAGYFLVKATYAGLTDLAALEVRPGEPADLAMTPGSATVLRNQQQTFAPVLRDQFGNRVEGGRPDVDYDVPLDVDCSGTGQLVCSSAVVGTHLITATLREDSSQQATATLVVEPGVGVVSDLTLTLDDLAPTAGETVPVTVTGLDSDGRQMDVTDETELWVMTSDANATHDIPNDCADGACTFKAAGTFQVTALHRGLTTSVLVEVSPAAVEKLELRPGTAHALANQPQMFEVRALDSFGNEVSLGSVPELTIDAPGLCGPGACLSPEPGNYVVSVTALGLTATAELSVHPAGEADPDQVARIAVSQVEGTVPAGQPGSFVVYGFDADGRPLGEVTDQSTLTIEGAGSWTTPVGTQTLSCTANTCLATVAGAHTVTATFGELTATTSLLVTAERDGHSGLGLMPGNAVVTVGERVRYSIGSMDRYGNPAGSGSAPFPMTMVASAGATCDGQTCWSDTPGTYVIGADLSKLLEFLVGAPEVELTWMFRAVLTVLPAPVDHIEITPDSARVAAGEEITLTATAYDADDNVIGDVTGETTFGADGDMACTANVCRSTVAGTYAIEGSHDEHTDTAEVTVTAAEAARDALTPTESTIRVGESVDYLVTRFDQFDNVIGVVTDDYTFTASADASCTGARCESRTVGQHEVTASAPGQPDLTARFTVELPDSAYLVVTPDEVTVAAGVDGTFTAALHDADGSLVADVTAETTFEASDGARCAAASCSSTTAGDYVVTGSYDGLDDDAVLKVLAAGVDRIEVSPKTATIDSGATQAFSVAGFDEFDNPVGDLTDDATYAISGAGSCIANECGAERDGAFTVTVSYVVPVPGQTGPTGPSGPPLTRVAPQAAAPGDTLTDTAELTVRAADTGPGDDPEAPDRGEDGPDDGDSPSDDDGDQRDDGGREGGSDATAGDGDPTSGVLPAAGATLDRWHAGVGALLLLTGMFFLRRRAGA